MKRPLLFKLSTIALLILLLMIPILMIDGIIGERRNLQQSVIDEIARSSSTSQKLLGPVLVIPYVKKIKEWKTNAATQQEYQQEVEYAGNLYFLPEAFVVDGKLNTEKRKRGIYEARLYHADNNISGHFEVPLNYGISDNIDDYKFEAPYVAMGIKDIRGIENALKIKINDNLVDMQSGTRLKILGEGVHAAIDPLQANQKTRLDFALQLVLQGTETLSIVPIGRESNVSLAADWPHPSFIGNYLPKDHEISSAGFVAHWRTSYFSSNLAEIFSLCAQLQQCDEVDNRYFGVSLIDPVDQYVKSDRAIKYALLFIGLTFAGFFLFEVLKSLAVHPVQYGLVGLSLAFFYLLLVSLSEHIAFALAYAISSASCILLIGFYLSHVLRSAARAVFFSGLLATLYGLLYGLLSAEDYALLMGAILLFGLLGVFMILTRKLDWYSVGKTDMETGTFSVGTQART
ncbi:MAG TPA: cell envelope integrity protein CreD [Cellvibrio sp.]|nr:cell envelope integrity protein CreD [Cellvibrio sp.]